jgi:hypothetical protein
MNASRYVGRIGGLAVALGVGAAVFTNCGIACAQPASSNSSGSSSSGSGTSGESGSGSAKTPKGSATSTQTSTGSGSSAASPSTGATTSAAPGGGVTTRGSHTHRKTLADILGAHQSASTPAPQSASGTGNPSSTSQTSSDANTEDSAQSTGNTTGVAATQQRKRDRSSSRPTRVAPSSPDSSAAGTNSATGATNKVVVKTRSTATSLPTSSVAVTQAATTTSTLSSVSAAQSSLQTPSLMVTTQPATPTAATPVRSVLTALATMVNRILSPLAGTSPTAPAVDPPTNWVLLAAARRELSGAAVSSAATNPIRVTPDLIFDPISPLTVTAFYGKVANPPAVAGTVQGEQTFNVVYKGAIVGTFTAQENKNGTSTSRVLLVTSADPIDPNNVGTDDGQVPPVGSVIAATNNGGFGSFYSAMPSPSGGDVTSYRIVTPFGDIPLRTAFDAAKGIADHSMDNRPVQLNNGYYIAPADPSAENFTAITGVPPYFVAVQGDQVFNVYQTGTNALVGSFHGQFTTTSDFFGTYTQAILVTEDLTPPGEVGTDAGQVPPVGSVYNVIYWGNDNNYNIYSSLPNPSGDDVISDILVSPARAVPIRTTFNASAPLPVQLSVPGAYSFVPTSALEPAGINGLPPREAIIQGYQQFDVVDSKGNKIGSFDADVTTQRDIFGTYSESVLVTNVTGGIEGTADGQVPPEGSEFNFFYNGNGGFGNVYSAMPSPSGDKISYTLVTPLGNFPSSTSYSPAGLADDLVL